MIVVSSCLTIVSVFLPWLDLGGVTSKAWDELNGPTIAFGAFGILFVAVHESMRRKLKVPWAGGVVAPTRMWWAWAAWAFLVYLSAAGIIHIIDGPGLERVGFGLWAILAGQAVTGLAFLLLGRAPETPDESDRDSPGPEIHAETPA